MRLDVHLPNPIYLENAGVGQNMVAVGVYLRDGSFMSDGPNSYIELDAQGVAEVTFVAFCVDFERENPSQTDSFSLGPVPPDLMHVLGNIRSYLVANPGEEITAAAQLAIWLSEGESIDAVRSQFDLTAEDERLANLFVR
jgi:hypothetical protein